jgi:hypothetical protein
MSAGVAVVHLVRAANGPEPFRSFLDSYRRQDAGLHHELVLLFKGFASERDAEPYLAMADGLGAHALHVADEGFDLGAYQTAAERLQADTYCFLNSFSRLLAPGWLGHLHAAITEAGVGLAGASGSYGSLRSFAQFQIGLGGPYAKVMPDRKKATATLEAIARQAADATTPGNAPRAIPVLTFGRAVIGQFRGFGPFPEPHIRTNGFMIGHELFSQLRMPPVRHKNDAYRLESGRASITAQVEHRGLSARVVGRDGVSYGATDWNASGTFWQGDQANLLLADKQTDAYERGTPHERDILARYAWGERATASA